jgi:hypothetical protein
VSLDLATPTARVVLQLAADGVEGAMHRALDV